MAEPRPRPIRLTLPAAALMLLATCSGNSGGGAHSATLTLFAAPSGTGLANVVLTTGCDDELDVASALFRVGDVTIEIHPTRSSGDKRDDDSKDDDSSSGAASMHQDDDKEGEHEGGNDDDQGDDGKDDDQGDDGDHEPEVVVLPGPYTFDVATETTAIDSVPVVPGTFDHVDLRFLPTDESPFESNSIVITGTFLPAAGEPVPFTLRSDFDGSMEVPVAGAPITVTENTVVPVVIEFDLQALFADVDVSKAVVENGEILIDATHNVDLLLAFEQALHGCIGAHERDDD